MIDEPRPTPDAAEPRDDWLDRALRANRAEDYIPDDGFSARVMAALPAPATLPAWRKHVLALLWAVAGIAIAFSLPGVVTEVARGVFRLVSASPVSLSGMVMAVVAMTIVTWTATAVVMRRE